MWWIDLKKKSHINKVTYHHRGSSTSSSFSVFTKNAFGDLPNTIQCLPLGLLSCCGCQNEWLAWHLHWPFDNPWSMNKTRRTHIYFRTTWAKGGNLPSSQVSRKEYHWGFKNVQLDTELTPGSPARAYKFGKPFFLNKIPAIKIRPWE